MKKRWIAFVLSLILALCCVLPCFAETELEDLTNAGNEVAGNQSDYFLYGVVIVAVLAVAIVGVFLYLRYRRK